MEYNYVTEPPLFAFKEDDDDNFSVEETSIDAFCQTINTETSPDMCARGSDGTKTETKKLQR